VTRWTCNLIRIRLAAIRGSMLPREFAMKKSVSLIVGEAHTVDVRIESVEGTCRGGQRRWFRCPNASCASKTVVSAFDPLSGIFGCRRCLHWRSRAGAAAPHTRATIQIGR
jgi:hypothetical protein